MLTFDDFKGVKYMHIYLYVYIAPFNTYPQRLTGTPNFIGILHG